MHEELFELFTGGPFSVVLRALGAHSKRKIWTSHEHISAKEET